MALRKISLKYLLICGVDVCPPHAKTVSTSLIQTIIYRIFLQFIKRSIWPDLIRNCCFFHFFKHQKIARSRRVDNGIRNFEPEMWFECDRWNFEIVVFISLFICTAALCLSKQSMIVHRYGVAAVSKCLPAVLIFLRISAQK